MSIDIFVPDIGSDEVEITEILVKIGDVIEEDAPLITVEGDKASMEIPASQAGIVKEIHVNVGDNVATGSLIMTFNSDHQTDTVEQSAQTSEIEKVTENQTSSSSVSVMTVPDIGDDEVDVVEIMLQVGDTFNIDTPVMTVEGDKASMEIPASEAGKVTQLLVSVGDKVKTGMPIIEFMGQMDSKEQPVITEKKVNDAPSEPKKAVQDVVKKAEPETLNNDFVENEAYAYATPVIRRLARELGVNLSQIKGTGRKQRIIKEDVHQYVKSIMSKVANGQGAMTNGGGLNVIPWPKVDFSQFGVVETVDLSKIKKLSGANLARNWAMIPHVTQFDEADITDLEAFRKEQNTILGKKDAGFKVTPLVLIMKAVAKVLLDFPIFNASLSEDLQQVVMKKYINIGIAVDTPNGLVVPVIKDVDKKGIYELSQELITVSKKARVGKLTMSDMQGGCFTISSLGGIGGTSFTPIINAPEVAILGVSKAEMKPSWNGKDFDARLKLPLSLSYDHRVIDGADGARFTTQLVAYLSDLRKLIL